MFCLGVLSTVRILSDYDICMSLCAGVFCSGFLWTPYPCLPHVPPIVDFLLVSPSFFWLHLFLHFEFILLTLKRRLLIHVLGSDLYLLDTSPRTVKSFKIIFKDWSG